MNQLKEECGLFGVYNNDAFETSKFIYYGLFALQHRGQEGCGIAVNNGGKIIYQKELGLVSEVFNEFMLNMLIGNIGIGHVRYSVSEKIQRENTQPLVFKYTKGNMAIAQNGNIFNTDKIRTEFEELGAIFQTNTDTEVVSALLSRERMKCSTLEDALVRVMKIIKGAYSLLIMSPRKLIAARDPYGMRPLVIGKKDNSYIVCSETAALHAVGAEFIRDVRPGEIIIITEDGLKSIQTERADKTAMCIFEFVYFARTDSVIDSVSVYTSRFEMGRHLAMEHKFEADAVMGVPDSGITAALGYANYSGIPYIEGLNKNRYIGRTFIQPTQELREQSVIMKISPIGSQIEGKRIILIDDSIVRGTTSKKIVQLLKDAGAKEVHMLVSSPPVKHPCYFGIDIKDENDLIATTQTLDEIRETIGADSLGFLSIDGLLETPLNAKCGFCSACFDGKYPMDITEE